MRKYFSARFLDYAGERALKTAIQALVAGGVVGGELLGLNWPEIASIAGGTVLLSVFTSILIYKGDGTDIVDVVVER